MKTLLLLTCVACFNNCFLIIPGPVGISCQLLPLVIKETTSAGYDTVPSTLYVGSWGVRVGSTTCSYVVYS